MKWSGFSVWLKWVRSLAPIVQQSHRQGVSLQVELLESRIAMDGRSAGINGINARGLGLTGDGVHIGIVDHWRLGSAAIGDNKRYLHPDVIPAGVYFQDKPGDSFQTDQVKGHPLWVSGVMVSTNAADARRGVSPKATVHSSGFTLGEKDDHDMTAALRSMLHIASLKPNPKVPHSVVAVNMSFGFGEKPANLNGDSQISLGVDYLAQKYDTLFVLAKGQRVIGAVPQDSYNGLVMGGSDKQVDPTAQFVWKHTDFTTATQDRRLIHLIAPADVIEVPTIGGGYEVKKEEGSGTSLSAPHATGAVALLQEYVATQNTWVNAEKDAARRHEVMKAILINSADKVKGVLGMKRDIFQQDNRSTWLESDARDDVAHQPGRKIPLDEQFGAGYLNVGRALDQLKGGRAEPYGQNEKPGVDGKLLAPPANPGKVGSYINWDYNSIEHKESTEKPAYNRYRLPELKKGDWIASTLG